GAFLNGKPIRVSKTARLSAGMISCIGLVEKGRLAPGRALRALMEKADYCYGFMDAYSYVCCAAGKLDACVNLLDKPWDCAAGACIVREAGGAFSDINGKADVFNGSIILSNGRLHGELLRYFKK
ncbi:MAG: hypothetical protein PHC61_14920, partial [Chitinivibrionales bacterium]|nr:hypothetical protein [Chitinivibrionales bacterium]